MHRSVGEGTAATHQEGNAAVRLGGGDLLLRAFRIAIHGDNKKQTNSVLALLPLFKFLQILHPSLLAPGWLTPTALSLVSLGDSIRFLKREEGIGPKALVEGLPLARTERSPFQPEGRRS